MANTQENCCGDTLLFNSNLKPIQECGDREVPALNLSLNPIENCGGPSTISIDGAKTFLQLTDTPISYASQAGKGVRVNSTANGLEFYNIRPNELTFYWRDFIDNGEDGRVRYENSELAGWTPIFVIGNIDKHLLKFIDFIPLSTGGFELKSDGNISAIFDGQVGWIVGYEPYIAPPDPIIPEPPTNGIVDDNNDTFTFTGGEI